MAKLVPIQLEDGSEIYIESTEDANAVPALTDGVREAEEEEEESVRGGQKGWGGNGASRGFTGVPGNGGGGAPATMGAQSFKAIESTIRTYTSQTLKAFENMNGGGNVSKVTLQFGIRLGGEAGIPYVTKGTAESNLSITVECQLDQKQ
jgi:hypothetical protein